MAKHAVLSPSSSGRWLSCPGSVAACEGLESKTSKPAAEGTVAHAIGAALLMGEPLPYTAGQIVEEQGHSIKVDEELIEFCDTYATAVLDAAGGAPIMAEQQVPIHHLTGEEGATGTADAIVFREDELQVHDLKFGRGVDGKTDLYGLLFKPTDFNASENDPVVETVYPGPWIIVTAKSFPSDMAWVNKIFWRAQAVAELGFVVITLDGPGTPFRSKQFHDACYGHLGEAGGLEDHVNALKQLSQDRPYMDLDRVGMFGHSAGGFMTAQALLTYPEFYKAGVASAGDYDSSYYGAFWGEKYEGLDASDYLEQIPSLKAGNLTGKLLLVAGRSCALTVLSAG